MSHGSQLLCRNHKIQKLNLYENYDHCLITIRFRLPHHYDIIDWIKYWIALISVVKIMGAQQDKYTTSGMEFVQRSIRYLVTFVTQVIKKSLN